MKKTLPTKEDLIFKIESLKNSVETREDIANWATAIIDDDSIDVTDPAVWKVLKKLGGADLVGDGRLYLFNENDFSDWESDIS